MVSVSGLLGDDISSSLLNCGVLAIDGVVTTSGLLVHNLCFLLKAEKLIHPVHWSVRAYQRNIRSTYFSKLRPLVSGMKNHVKKNLFVVRICPAADKMVRLAYIEKQKDPNIK